MCCPLCRGPDPVEFWRAEEMPVLCNVLCPTRESALTVPRGQIRLFFCHECSFIWNGAFDARCVVYGLAYENALHHSPRFREYAEELARRLVRDYDLAGKTVLEIGCGQGAFLSLVLGLGVRKAIGFDPSYNGGLDGHPNVEIHRTTFSDRPGAVSADLVLCRHVLEHTPDPVSLLAEAKRCLSTADDGMLFVEVPNATNTFCDSAIWDIIYEHCNYFTSRSLRRCAERAGFAVRRSACVYDGQFLSIDAGTRGPSVEQGPSGEGEAPAAAVRLFGDRYKRSVEAWRSRLEGLRRAGETAAVWGAGSKGVTFLNVLHAGVEVDRVVDINPRKQGQFVAGSGQQIVAPRALRTDEPKWIILLNPIYGAEVRRTLADLRVSSEILES